jgi:hypothetical protein
MPVDPPIGHLEFDPQRCRDAAAGPPIGKAPRGQDWPKQLNPQPVHKHRGGGGYHPGGIRFKCDTCQLVVLSINELVLHAVAAHRRPPHDAERVPLPAVQQRTGRPPRWAK